ncbi:unnamed protein product, partial [Natator depressus]
MMGMIYFSANTLLLLKIKELVVPNGISRLFLTSRRLTGLVLREPELRLVLSAYADDVLLVVQDPGDLARVELWLGGGGLAAGLCLHYKRYSGYNSVDAFSSDEKSCS